MRFQGMQRPRKNPERLLPVSLPDYEKKALVDMRKAGASREYLTRWRDAPRSEAGTRSLQQAFKGAPDHTSATPSDFCYSGRHPPGGG